MRKFFILFISFLFHFNPSFSQPCSSSSGNVWPTKCFEIASILVDACDGGNEGQNEMVRLQIGPTPLLISGFSIPAYGGSGFVNWGTGASNTWRSFANYNTASLAKISTINSSITLSGHCGVLIPLNNNQFVPANSNLLIITSTAFNPLAQSFDNLMDTLYVVMQTSGNTSGHFANNSVGAPYDRKLIINHTLCSDTVTYQKNQLLKQDLTNGAEDGGTVNFAFNGADTYVNYGCAVPITPITFDAGTVTGPFCSGSQVQLNASVSGTNCFVWRMKDTTQGSYTDSTILIPKFNIKPNLPATNIVLYFALRFNCSAAKDSVIIPVSASTTTLFAGNDTSICNRNLVPLKASSNATGTLLWTSSGAGTFSNTNSLISGYTPAATEQGIVYLRIQQQTLCGLYFDSLKLTITPAPNPNFTFTSSIICPGAPPITLTPQTTGGIFSGSVLLNGNQFNPTTSGNFPIKYVIGTGGCKDSSTQTIVVTPKPNPNFLLPNSNICLGSLPMTLTPVQSGGVFTGTQVTSNQFTPATSGVFPIKYVISSGGCIDSNEQSVTVKPLPNPAFTPTETKVCEGSKLINLNPTTTGGIFSGNSFINVTSFDPKTAGSYIIKYVITVNGCSDSTNQTIIVDPKPDPNFTMNDTVFCVGDPSELLIASDPSGMFSGAHVSGNLFDPKVAGNFTIQYNIGKGSCIDSSKKIVTVNELPVAAFKTSPSIGRVNEPVQFTFTGKNAVSYDWIFGNPPVGNSNNQNPVFTFTKMNNYEVTLIVENEGCFDTITLSIPIQGADTLIVPNVFTPNGDSVNDYFTPVSLNINTYNILIYNRWGGLVYENNTLESNWNGTYKGEPCAIGVYFYVLNATSYSGREYNLNGTVTLIR